MCPKATSRASSSSVSCRRPSSSSVTLGSILSGLATPTEGAALGCAGRSGGDGGQQTPPP